MTKEEIAKTYVPCRCDIAYTSRGLSAPDCPYHSTDPEIAMDEYASQQRIEILEWLRKQPVSVMSKTSTQIDIQFIEQQTENK